MSRAHVALDQLRQLTDGTPADLAALLEEVVVACPIAGPWREVRIGLSPSWSRGCVVRTARGDQFPALVELAASPEGAWAARCGGIGSTVHATPEAARAACDERLRALGWLLL